MPLLSRARVLGLLAAAPLAVSCGPRDTIRAGSKNFTEELILGELYAQAAEHQGFGVTRRMNLGTTDIALAALHRDELDFYPEYTGTALLNVLHLPPDSDPQRSYRTVKAAFEKQYGLIWLAQSPMNDTQALATTSAVARAHALRTLSDLAARASSLRLGTVPEFLSRADGLPGLRKRYGGFHFAATKILDNGLKYQALAHGDVDVVVAFSTEGQLVADKLVVLDDDKHLFPAYHVAPVVRAAVLGAKPKLAGALDAVTALLSDGAMQQMNLAVDGPQKAEPADVARDFLKQHGLG